MYPRCPRVAEHSNGTMNITNGPFQEAKISHGHINKSGKLLVKTISIHDKNS